MRDKVIHIASVGYELPYKLTLFNNLSNKIMPKKRRQNGELEKGVMIPKIWIEIPIEDDDVPAYTESYLVTGRVADYIEFLESKILEHVKILPKLKIKE